MGFFPLQKKPYLCTEKNNLCFHSAKRLIVKWGFFFVLRFLLIKKNYIFKEENISISNHISRKKSNFATCFNYIKFHKNEEA
jgi:hypothetical protein